MPRPKSLNPTPYQRGKNGNWFFKRSINGKMKELPTYTTDKTKAESYIKQYVRLEIEAENKERRGELAIKTAQSIMMSVRGESIERITFDEAFKVYVDTTDDFMDLAQRYRDVFTTTCRKFFVWCQGRGLQFMDEVSDEVARNYAKMLTADHFAPKTFDDYIKVLSKFFTTVDAMKKLPNRNPFNKTNIKRKKKGLVSDASHRPFEPDMINKVMTCAAKAGEDWYDLFLVGLHTGMRLKDSALLRWEAVQRDFVEIIPHKTSRYGTVARVPISGDLRQMLDKRKSQRGFNQYVNPVIAGFYLSGSWPSDKSQDIIVEALGKENTIVPKGEHRKVNTSIYTFESFRTTFATLLGNNNTEYRTVMEMMGWSSWSMLKIYEKKYNYNSNIRDQEKIQAVQNLGILSESTAGIVPAPKRLTPTKEALERLLDKYSNIAIGKIYDITEAAVRKRMKEFGLARKARILSPDITDEEIKAIRERLTKKAA